MCDPETFLTILYVMVDDCCQTQFPPSPTPAIGRPPSLTRSEVVTLALLSRWRRFASERDFHRWAVRHLRHAFPTLPRQSQFNRLVRHHLPAITACFQALADLLATPTDVYEVLDSTAAPIRNTKRRGDGWLAGQADRGWSNRLGWYVGFKVLLAVRPTGVITGFGFAPASTNDYPLAETFFAVRAQPTPALPSVGRAAPCPYLADKGIGGPRVRSRWRALYGAAVVAPPRKSARQPWPKPLRRWLAGLRQLVETVNGTLIGQFGFADDRPKVLPGFQARLAARMALHNFCIWLNQQLGRPHLAFVDLVDW